MAESISERLNSISSNKDGAEVKFLLDSVLTDLTAIRTPASASIDDYTSGRTQIVALVANITALATALDTLATKLNADTGVADEDYAANNAAAITAVDPDAITAETPDALTLTE